VRVLLVNNLYSPYFFGGAQRVVQDLAEVLVKAGHQVIVVSTAPHRGVRVGWINGVKVYYIGFKNLYWPYKDKKNKLLKPLWHALETYNPLMTRELGRILDTERPDLVHTNLLVGFSVLAWQLVKQRSLPLVHTLHDYYLLCPRSNMFRGGQNCATQCAECALYALPRIKFSNKVDAVVGVSQFVLERHLKFNCFAAVSKRRAVSNAYQVELDTPPSDTQSLPVRFGFLGRIHETKGLEVLLNAVVKLPHGAWTLHVAGQGPSSYERYLRNKYKAPAIKFVGFVQPQEFFSDVDVLVVPSLWHDPLPTVIIEAYAHGVPVIGSIRGGIPELVEEGNTGFLFDPNRPDDLTTKMRRLIDKPPMIEVMRSVCLKKANSFLPGNVAEHYLDVYAGAMGGVRD